MRKDSSIPYVYRKRGVYYFSRRVPKDLLEFHKHPNLTLSLKTKSSRVAKAKSATLAAQLDEQWLTLRWRQNDNPLSRFLVDQTLDTSRASNAPLLSEAKGIYLTAKAITRPVTFEQSVERAIGVLSNVAGDKPLDKYTRQDCPSSKHLGLLSLLFSGGFGSSWFNVKPLVVGGSSGVSG